MDRQALLKSVPEGEERLLFAKALDQAIFAMKRREPAFTDFMDRAKCARFRERLQGLRELEITLFGGTEDCERQMMGFFTEPLAAEKFPIKIVKIRRKSKKFGQTDLSHRDYLGSLLGLGIDRGKVGDILVAEDTAGLLCGRGNFAIHNGCAGAGFQNRGSGGGNGAGGGHSPKADGGKTLNGGIHAARCGGK